MTRLSIRLALFLLLTTFVLPGLAAAFEILPLPLVTDRALDAWHDNPVGSEPALYPAKRVYPGQPFRVLVMAKGYKTDSLGAANITYSVALKSPNGTELFRQEPPLELFKGKVGNDTALLLSRNFLTLDFSGDDPPGPYRLEITAHDLLGEQSIMKEVEIVLADFSDRPGFDSPDNLLTWLDNYYRAPDPARAVTVLLQYVDPDVMAGEQQSGLLVFLRRVVTDNPFLWPHLKQLFTAADAVDRKKILLLAALGDLQDDAFLGSLSPELTAYYQSARRISLPDLSDRPVTEIEINALWAEFRASGTFEPIRKLTGSLALATSRGTQEALAAGSLQPTPEVRARAALESVYQMSLGALLHNGEHHSLVRQYLAYIVEQDTADTLINSQLRDILDLLQRRANEEAARKHLEEQTQDK